MKIIVLHGQMHRGSTWHITQAVLARLPGADIQEFYLPKDGPDFCAGCFSCFYKGEEHCPHAAAMTPLLQAVDGADVLVFDSPCYVMGMSGQLKAFFDHMGFRFMVHRPEASMFGKVGLCISTAAGGGADRATKDMARSLFFWGVAKTFRYAQNVGASSWEEVKPALKQKIERNAARLAARVARAAGHAQPGLKSRALFAVMRATQKGNDWNPLDRDFWESRGWLGAARPWKGTPVQP